MQAQQLPRCSGPMAAATSAAWRGAPSHRTPPSPLPQAPTYPAGLLRERIWLLRIPCVLPPPAPTGDSSSGCPPSLCPPAATLAAPRAPREPEQQVGALPPAEKPPNLPFQSAALGAHARKANTDGKPRCSPTPLPPARRNSCG